MREKKRGQKMEQKIKNGKGKGLKTSREETTKPKLFNQVMVGLILPIIEFRENHWGHRKRAHKANKIKFRVVRGSEMERKWR